MRFKHRAIVKPSHLHHGHDRKPAYPMQWRVNNSGIPRPGPTIGPQGLEIGGVDLLRADPHLAAGQRVGERYHLDLIDMHHALDNRAVVRWQDLPASRPIHFHRIVAGRIVAGRHHDAAVALFVSDRKGQLRRRAVLIQKNDLESVGYHHRSAQLRKLAGSVPSIVGDGAFGSPAGGAFGLLQNIRRKPLRALTDRPLVDGVGTEGVHPPPAPPGTERYDGPEDIVQLLPFPLRDMLDDRLAVGFIPRLGQPSLHVLQCAGRDLALFGCLPGQFNGSFYRHHDRINRCLPMFRFDRRPRHVVGGRPDGFAALATAFRAYPKTTGPCGMGRGRLRVLG